MKFQWVVCRCIPIILTFSSTATYAAENMEEFFSMSPAELAATPVTIATGTARPNFRSAGSTSVISAEQIKTMGATELHEVLETVPGVHASLQPMSNDLHYNIRGIANKNNSQILFLLNGTRITTAFRGSTESSLDLPVAAIERVEVIRGPGSMAQMLLPGLSTSSPKRPKTLMALNWVYGREIGIPKAAGDNTEASGPVGILQAAYSTNILEAIADGLFNKTPKLALIVR